MNKPQRKTRGPSRVRDSGIIETNTKGAVDPGLARIEAFRDIVKRHQYAIIDGHTVDGFTASAVVQVYDALNEQNKAKLRGLGVMGMVNVTWKVLK